MNGSYRGREVAEANLIEKDWGYLNWLASKELTGTEDITVGRVMIKKGMSNPRHCHPNCLEVLYLLEGSLEHTIGDEKVALEAGDTIIIPDGIMHNALNVGNRDAEMIVTYSSGERQFSVDCS